MEGDDEDACGSRGNWGYWVGGVGGFEDEDPPLGVGTGEG